MTFGPTQESGARARRVDVATEDMAVDVHLQVLAGFYTVLLGGIQTAAESLGYHFVEASAGEGEQPLPEALERMMAWGLADARRQYLYDQATIEQVDDDVESGYATRFVRNILEALRVRGLILLAEPGAAEKLKAPERITPEEMLRLTDAFFEAIELPGSSPSSRR